MFSDANTLLDISDRQLPQGLLYHIADMIGCNGDFLLHHFISVFLKGDGRVCIISLSQTFHHYFCVARKQGINLQTAQTDGRVTVIDCLSSLPLGKTPTVNPPQTQSGKPDSPNQNQRLNIRQLYMFVKNVVEGLFRDGKDARPVCVILDDVTALLSLGYTPVEVRDFVHYCRNMMMQGNKARGCVVSLGHYEEDSEDPEQELLHRLLQYRADVLLRVRGLDTGFSVDVHGQVSVQRKHTPAARRFHYKATDNNVSLFAIGTSSAVL